MASLRRFLSAETRIGRRPLWLAWAAQSVAAAAFLAIAILVIDPSETDPPPVIVAIEIGLFAIYLLSVAASALLGIKRLQTRGLSGWWCLVVFVPFVGVPWYLREVGLRRDEPAQDPTIATQPGVTRR